MAISKSQLLKREAELIKTLEQFDQLYESAAKSGQNDLKKAYSAGNHVLFAKLEEIQDLIRICGE